MQVPELPPTEVHYCRSLTIVWCGFFVVNGSISGILALTGATWAWPVYTGFVSYLLIGRLFSGEFLVRSWRFGRYAGTPLRATVSSTLSAAARRTRGRGGDPRARAGARGPERVMDQG